MIYWQNRILTNVKVALEGKCENVVAVSNNVGAEFPSVLVSVISNSTVADDLEFEENAVRCGVNVEAYSKKSMQDALDLIDTANSAMYRMGFRRSYGPSKQKNIESPEVFRVVARYSRIIGADDEIESWRD